MVLFSYQDAVFTLSICNQLLDFEKSNLTQSRQELGDFILDHESNCATDSHFNSSMKFLIG